ncbi:MAG: hypothetical protein V1844_12105, partial [Pseudomonadota bacterium]
MLEKESLSNQTNSFGRKGGEKAIKMTENLETLSIEELRQTIHELRVHQIELEESEARLDQLIEQSRTIAWEVDADGLYTYVSHVSETVLGYRGSNKDITDQKRAESLLHIRLDLVDFASDHSLDELLQKTLDEVG